MELLDLMNNLSIKHTEEDKSQRVFKSVTANIDGESTEIVIAEYTQKSFLILSQLQKLGSMLFIQKDQAVNLAGSNDIFSIKVIFGSSNEEAQVAGRYLAEQINIQKPLYLIMSLKSYDIETIKACKDLILALKQQIDNDV